MPDIDSATIRNATPQSTRERGIVPKRRFQKGCLQVKNGMAYTFYYEDVETPDGGLMTRKVRQFIGRVPADMSERAAQREHARIMEIVNNKRGSVAPTVKGKTFRNAVEAWRGAIAPILSPATVRQMESYLRSHIFPRFGEDAPHSLDVVALQMFATDLLVKKQLSQKTVVNILGTIFSILKYAERCRMQVAKVSFKDLHLGTVNQVAERPFFTREQAQRIIAASEEPYKTLFSLAWLTGLRAGELLALKISDLNFANHTIQVSKSADDNTRELRQPKTSNSIALLPMPSALQKMLENYLACHWTPNEKGYLFPNPKGTHPRWRDNVVKYGLKPVLRKLGIPEAYAGLHAFRHGLATELVQRSTPLPDVQKQMRHADVRTTLKIYSHAIPATQRAAMESLASEVATVNQYNVPISTERGRQVFAN
jgi:integrase